MGYKKRVTAGDLQRRLGVSWPPAERIVARSGFGQAIAYEADTRQDGPRLRWTVSEETADAVVAAFKKEQHDAFWSSRPGRSERRTHGS